MWAHEHMKETICGCDHFFAIPKKKELRNILISGIVIAYTRSFVNGQGMSNITGDYSKFSDPDMKTFHKKICDARNFIYAHHDTFNEASIFDHTKPKEEINRVIFCLDSGLDSEIKCSWEIEKSGLSDGSIEDIKKLAEFQKQRMHTDLLNMLKHFIKENRPKPGKYCIAYDNCEFSYYK